MTGPVLAVLAVLTMTVGNLVALRQRRMVRLLAWSSVAQAGYILAPLGALALAAGRTGDAGRRVRGRRGVRRLLRRAGAGRVRARWWRCAGGRATAARSPTTAARPAARPWPAAAFVLALVGLAGLPPGLAGLFAKVTVVRALLDGGAAWLALVVALNAVIGLAYYLRVAAALCAPPARPTPAAGGRRRPRGARGRSRSPWSLAGRRPSAAIVLGFAPQLVLDLAGR